MNVWTRIELAVKSTSRHSPLPWVGLHTYTRARATMDTNTLTASSEARTYGHTHTHPFMIHTWRALVLWRVGVRTCSVFLTQPDEMMPSCKRERGLYRFYKMAGYTRLYTRLCGRSHERLAECVWMHVALRYGWAGISMESHCCFIWIDFLVSDL